MNIDGVEYPEYHFEVNGVKMMTLDYPDQQPSKLTREEKQKNIWKIAEMVKHLKIPTIIATQQKKNEL